MSVIRGKSGRILIDPLLSAETAAAALDLVKKHLGKRPVTAVIFTHSHIDHYGGIRGVVNEADVRREGFEFLRVTTSSKRPLARMSLPAT